MPEFSEPFPQGLTLTLGSLGDCRQSTEGWYVLCCYLISPYSVMPWLGGPIRYTPTVWSFEAVTKSIKKVILRRTIWNHSQTRERERLLFLWIFRWGFSRLISINILKFYTDDVPPEADPGEGLGGAGLPPPLFLDQTEGPKKFFGRPDPPLPLSKGLDDQVPSLPPLISRSGSGTGHYLYLDQGRE